MGTVSDKLTYLNNTKTALKDSINLMGVNITDDTFRSYPEKIKAGLLDIINNGTDTVWNNWEKVSATDVAEATLQNTVEAPMKTNIKGNTKQTQLTGKNLLPMLRTGTEEKNGITFTVNADKSITVNGKATADAYFYLVSADGNNNIFTLKAGSYTRKCVPDGQGITGVALQCREDNSAGAEIFSSAGVGLKTTTLEEDTVVYPRLRIVNNTEVNNLTIYPMIVAGTYTSSTVPEYEEYCGRNTKSKFKFSAECSCSNRK